MSSAQNGTECNPTVSNQACIRSLETWGGGVQPPKWNVSLVPRLSTHTFCRGKPGIFSHVSDVGVDARVDMTKLGGGVERSTNALYDTFSLENHTGSSRDAG